MIKTNLSAAKMHFKYMVLAADKKVSAAKTYVNHVILAADK